MAMDIISSIDAPVVQITNDQITTTSTDIAKHFGKRHADVLRRVEKLGCSAEFSERNFALAEYKAAQFKEAYINAFNQMEKQLNEQKQLPATTDNLALAETDKYQLLNNIVKSMQIQSDPVVVPSKELIDLIQAVRTFLTKKATANSTTANTRLGKRQHHPRQRLRPTQLCRLLSDKQLKPT
jgi:phage regulator Rha-like protein